MSQNLVRIENLPTWSQIFKTALIRTKVDYNQKIVPQVKKSTYHTGGVISKFGSWLQKKASN